MVKYLLRGSVKLAGVCSALLALTLLSNCSDNAASKHENIIDGQVPPPSGPVEDAHPVIPIPPLGTGWDIIQLMVKTDPLNPQNERFLDDWRFRAWNIDDEGRQLGPIYYGDTGPDGLGVLGLPAYMFALPLVIKTTNDAFPLLDFFPSDDESIETDECLSFEIFVPAGCYNKSVWMLGPAEDAVWKYYRKAARQRADSWNPSQVDCATWLADLQGVILTDQVNEALQEIGDSNSHLFRRYALIEALQENQNLLVPTRPPICMAERRHHGGGMDRGDLIPPDDFPITLDVNDYPWERENHLDHISDPVVIDSNGLVSSICGVDLIDELKVNTVTFAPKKSYYLDDIGFIGTIHDDWNIVQGMDVSTFNVKLGNGQDFDADTYDDACAVTTLVQFTNTDDNEQDVLSGTGVYFTNLLGGATVWLTSDGDAVIDDDDFWAIFYKTGGSFGEEQALLVEFLGHREEDFRDVLHMWFNTNDSDLFLGLRADYNLNEEAIDGEYAFMGYTMSVWDGTGGCETDNYRLIRKNISDCYEAADVWARQFFVTRDFNFYGDGDCCNDEGCDIECTIGPLEAAEFAARSQCFSNSRANARWETQDVGFWSMNSIHGVPGNVVINSGWLAPFLDFEIYIQKFDEAVFKGPRTIRTTDYTGQMMIELPTLVEGDRVLIRAENNCCSDYDLVLPCVPEFTGFAGLPGIPYVPQVIGLPIGIPVEGAEEIPTGPLPIGVPVNPVK